MASRNKWKQFRPNYLAQRYLRPRCRTLPYAKNIKYKVESSIEFSVKDAVYIDMIFEKELRVVDKWEYVLSPAIVARNTVRGIPVANKVYVDVEVDVWDRVYETMLFVRKGVIYDR